MAFALEAMQTDSAVALEDYLYGPNPAISIATKLIPKDNQHVEDKNGLVYVFRGNKKSDSLNTIAICDKLEDLGYSVPEDNIHIIQKKKDLMAYLECISQEEHSCTSCLIVIFLGEFKDDYSFKIDGSDVISMQEVCSPFIKCSSLKSTPKIFIFQATIFKNLVVEDARCLEPARDVVRSHNIPDEPDILIVYKKIEGAPEERLKFIKNLCEVIDDYGMDDDIMTLLNHIDDGNNKLKVIKSTLTKKFYLPIMEK